MSGYTREEIIAAIQQATLHDGGKPPGKMRFETLSGIPRQAWLGVFWATWSEALPEAGHEPNPRNERRDADELLLQAVHTVRSLAKVPTQDELRMAIRSNPMTLSRTAFRSLGGRSGLAARLRELAESDPAYADLLDLLPAESAAEAATGHAPDDVPVIPPPPVVTGQVYLARMGKHYKIGRTNAAGRRMYELAIQLPERLTVVHVLDTDDPEGIERYWHERFREKRGNGEWFTLTRADVAAFKRRGRFM